MRGLIDAQCAQFAQQGFLVLERWLDEALLRRLEDEYGAVLDRCIDDWLAQGALQARPSGGFCDRLLAVYRAGLDWFQPLDISLPGSEIQADTPFHIGPAVFDLITAPALLDVAASLLGPELAANPIQHVRIKPPSDQLARGEERAHVGLTAWHQDRGVAHAAADRSALLTCWVAISEARRENGCLVVIPGPINDGLLSHCPAGQTHIPDQLLDRDRAVALEVPRGSVVLLHPSIPHASLPNVSDRLRWSFDLRYHRLGDHSGREHFPSFVVRSAAQRSVAGWREMHAAWAAARDRLAVGPHIPLHRWAGDAPVCA